MSVRKPNIKDVQKRVANISIGASTLRNQGAKGVTEKARGFLSDLDLTGLSNMTEDEFNVWLEGKTKTSRRL